MDNNDLRHFASSGYSNQYSALQQHHLEQLREEILGNKEDISIKNKKLSAETNKRRRDLINRKKARENEEEKRRNEILAERKARIQDVTHRYQRAGAARSTTLSHQRVKSPRAKRAYSAPVVKTNQINIEDALRAIKGNSQLQYNVGDSGAVFLQKYGAHLQAANGHISTTNENNASMSSSRNRLSMRQHLENGSSNMFDQQLAQHQAALNKSKAEIVQRNTEKLVQDMRLEEGPDAKPEGEPQDDARSIESLDSLESEQPSYRSHVIDFGAEYEKNTSSNYHNRISSLESHLGGDTYRQESPIVLSDHNQRSKAAVSVQSRVQSAPVYRQMASTTATPTTDPNAFLGFQVVNTTDHRSSHVATTPNNVTSKKQNKLLHSNVLYNPENIQGAKSNTHSVNNTVGEMGFENFSTSTNGDAANATNGQSGGVSFYLKSRTESQSLVNEFPAHAWGTQVSSPPTTEPNPRPQAPTVQPTNTNTPSESCQGQQIDMFSDTASDSGAPRSILKKRNPKSPALPRSHSSPSIRDSVELTKQHLQNSAGRVETPKSAKKSVRFSEKNSEPVFFQKGSSPSSIPRPVNTTRAKATADGVPHISSTIAPKVTDKTLSTKHQSSPQHKGPVVAKHNLHTNNADKPPETDKPSKAKPSLSDIRLDRTPTDDEIDILWDKVRDCLQESPSASARSVAPPRDSPVSSVRSAPPDFQQSHVVNSLPPKPPIKKITASNINLIGRAQSTGMRRQTSADGSLSNLQRPKQDQPSFLQPETRGQTHVMKYTHQGVNNVAPGHTDPSQFGPNMPSNRSNGPVPSALEPHLSAANSHNHVSESMMSYLAAEQLAARESLSDKDMMKVMADGAYKEELGVAYKPHPPMSALSLEEQRLLKSLDRLNNKLKVVEEESLSSRSQVDQFQGSGAAAQVNSGNTHADFSSLLTHHRTMLKPHPPYTGTSSTRSFSATARGFRGHKPLQPRQRTASADIVRHNAMNGAVSGSGRQFRLY